MKNIFQKNLRVRQCLHRSKYGGRCYYPNKPGFIGGSTNSPYCPYHANSLLKNCEKLKEIIQTHTRRKKGGKRKCVQVAKYLRKRRQESI